MVDALALLSVATRPLSGTRTRVCRTPEYRTGWGLLLFVPDLVMRYYIIGMPSAPRNADKEWLVGLRAIARYMGRSERTIRRWIDDQGFPAGMTPSGHWIASKQSIRDWVLVRGR